MPTRPIRITGSNSSTGLLTLDDDDHGHDHTRAKAGDTILWQIDAHAGVESIIAIEKKTGSADFWLTPPHPQGNNWTGEISHTAPVFARYVYAITWRAKDGTGSHTHDPIISIKPSTSSKDLLKTVLVVLAAAMAAVLGVFMFRSFLNKGSRR